MIKPDSLKRGDTVGLVAPSGPLTGERRQMVLDTMDKWGFKTLAGKSFYENDDYLAGSDDLRSEDINSLFENKDVKAIFAVRGGYGCQRIIHLLDENIIRENPKIFAGFSDITALHSFLNKLGLITYHSPMLGGDLFNDMDEITINSFLEMVCDEGAQREYSELCAWDYISGPSEAEGILTGGNLAIIASSVGTPYGPDFAGKIVFLEDVGEEPYRIDRMLNQLKQSGNLDKAAGFIFGHFTNCEPKAKNGYKALEVIKKNIEPLNKTCIFGFKAGHEKPNLTLPLGAYAKIDSKNITFRLE